MELLFGTTLRALWKLRRDEQFASLARLTVAAIASGTVFYWLVENLRFVDALYFSVTTLATVGYGDFTAASNLGHTLSVSEALLGQVYLVTIVSLIVGNLGRRRVR